MAGPSLDLSLFRARPSALSPSVSPSFEPSADPVNPSLSSPSLALDLFRASAGIPKELPKADPKADLETVQRLRGEGETFRKIEDIAHIPKSTAFDLLHNPSLRHGGSGRTPYLSNPNLEEQLHEKVVEMTVRHQPPSAVDLAELTGSLLSSPGHEIHPTAAWARTFASNHSESYNFFIPKKLEKERAIVDDPNVLVSWHDDIEKKANPNSIPACLTFNMDEFKLDVSESKASRVLTPKEFKHPSKLKDPKSPAEHITVALLSSPDPQTCRLLRPLVILPLVNLPADLNFLRDKFDFAGTPQTGWTNEKIFNAQCQSLSAQVAKIRQLKGLPPDAKGLQYLDADTSRRSPEGLEELAKNNIIGVGLLAHSTTITQPNDGGLIGSIKQKAGPRIKSILKNRFPGRTISSLNMGEKRVLYLTAIRDAIDETFAVDDRIKKAWKESSLYPFDRNVLFKVSEQKDKPLDRTKLDKMMAPAPGKKIPIHGKILTDKETYEPLFDEKRRASQRKGGAPRKPKAKPKGKPKSPMHLSSSSSRESNSSSSSSSLEESDSQKAIEKTNKGNSKVVELRKPSFGSRKRARVDSTDGSITPNALPLPLPTPSLPTVPALIPKTPLKDTRHAEDEALEFVIEDRGRNNRFDRWAKRQRLDPGDGY